MQLDAADRNLNQLFAVEGEQFTIPAYQRPYSWTNQEVDELWADLLSSMGGEHFMGPIVINGEDESKPQIVDGQQRLVTMILILGLLRDRYSELDSRFAERIQNKLSADQYAEGDAVFKLRAGDRNWIVLRDFVLRAPDDEERIAWEEWNKLPKALQSSNRPLRLEAVGNDEALAGPARDWLLEYNRGDVLATKRIRQWLADTGPDWPEVSTH